VFKLLSLSLSWTRGEKKNHLFKTQNGEKKFTCSKRKIFEDICFFFHKFIPQKIASLPIPFKSLLRTVTSIWFIVSKLNLIKNYIFLVKQG